MQYIIMIAIVVGLAASDIVTGFIKGYVTDRPRSRKMRIGGLHKLAEVTVMVTACGLEFGIERLGVYYDAAALAQLVGQFTAIGCFGFITVMELVSILENYAEINPEAAWVRRIIRQFRDKSDTEDERNEKTN